MRETRHLTLGERLWRLLLAASDLYAAPLVVYLTARLLFGERLWLVALLNNLIHWLLLPSFLLLILALWKQRWRNAALAGVIVIAFLWLFGGLFLPNPPVNCPAPCTTLTVMTYNIGDGDVPPDRLTEILRDSGADIVALQEVSAEQASGLQDLLVDMYPHRVLYGYGIPGLGLLSRYPILDHELSHLESPIMFHLRATLRANGDPLTVIITHPPRPLIEAGGYKVEASADITALTEIVSTIDGPLLLLGDLNITDQSDDYAHLTASGLTDAFRTSGWGFGATFPAGFRLRRWLPLPPLVRIDYIWYTDQFDATRAWVGPDTGSDHLPVLAELVWWSE